MRIGVTGASGFIGNRMVEVLHLGGAHQVLPLVRGNASLTMPARFELPWRVCDHFSAAEMAAAFEGCDVVVHAAFGSPQAKMNAAVYRAADAAGVRRLVVLSSASVYNQNPEPGTTEDSPLPARHATPYNANKIAGDEAVRRLRPKGKAEVVFLMPGIVYGPRSQWITRAAAEVMAGTAYLIGGGGGVCNAVYVDNLIEAALLALTADGVDGEAFFVSDAETVTWRDFYGPVLSAFGQTFDDVHFVAEPPAFEVSGRERLRERVQGLMETDAAKRLKPYAPAGVKRVYKTAVSLFLSGREAEPDAWLPPAASRPNVTLEMSLLQQCAYRLPTAKAERLLGYRPDVSFDEGMRRSVGWLKFAGYPVISENGGGAP